MGTNAECFTLENIWCQLSALRRNTEATACYNIATLPMLKSPFHNNIDNPQALTSETKWEDTINFYVVEGPRQFVLYEVLNLDDHFPPLINSWMAKDATRSQADVKECHYDPGQNLSSETSGHRIVAHTNNMEDEITSTPRSVPEVIILSDDESD